MTAYSGDPSARFTLEVRSRGGQGGISVRENLEHLIEPRDFKNGAHGFLQTSQQKFSTVGFHLLHRLNEGRQACAIDVSDLREIDHHAFRFFFDHGGERCRDYGRNVQIDLTLEGQHVGEVSMRLRSRWGRVLLFHSTLHSSMDHHPCVWIILSTFERSSIKKSG